MSIKQTVKKFTPYLFLNFFMKILNWIRLRKFYSLKKPKVNTNNLISIKEINLGYILNNEEILNSWKNWQDKLDSLNFVDFMGGVNPGDQRAIFYLIRYLKPKAVLEIGTHIGASTVNIASAINYNQNKLLTKSIFKTVDIRDVNSITKKPWLKHGMTKSPIEMIKEFDCFSPVDFITDISTDYLKNTADTFDFIFLDGDHSSSTVYQEIPMALGKLNKGGVILLHDYFPNGKPLWSNNYAVEGPYLAVERLISEINITILPLGSLPWKTKMGSNKTSLALCLKK